MPMIFFYFLKIIFDISTLKRSKKYKPHSILAKKKNSKFDETQLQTQCLTVPKSVGHVMPMLGMHPIRLELLFLSVGFELSCSSSFSLDPILYFG